MAKDNREKYETELKRLENRDISSADFEAIMAHLNRFDSKAFEGGNPPEGESTRSPSTLKNWAHYLGRTAESLTLTETSASELNSHNSGIESSEGTLRNWQNAQRAFFRFGDYGVDPSDIAMAPKPGSKDSEEVTGFDDRDILTTEEIQAIEAAIDHPRDLCVFHVLLFTGFEIRPFEPFG